MKRKGLSIPSILTILLTIAVVGGCVALYAAFRTDADLPTTTMKMAGLISDAFLGDDNTVTDDTVNVQTVTVPPRPLATIAPTAAPALPTNPPQVTLTLAGMAAFESNVADSVYDKSSMNCDYQQVLQNVAQSNTGHLRIAVLPQALNAEGKQYTDKAAHATAALALHNAGFNAVVLHADAVLQNGAQTAQDTAGVLYQNGLAVSGVNTRTSSQMLVTEHNGMKVAVIGYDEKMSNASANTLQSAAGNGMITADTAEELKSLIASARSQGCQCVMVYIHWKNTEVQKVTDEMRLTAKEITASGADIIVGTGIRRLLPAAWLNTSDDDGVDRRSLTLYSIGSLLTESRDGYDLSGALVHISLQAQGNGVRFIGLSYEPTYIWKQYMNGTDQYRVVLNGLAPSGMNDNQKSVMERCKTRTDESLLTTLLLTNEE